MAAAAGGRKHGGWHQLLKLPHEADSHRLSHVTDQMSVKLSPNFKAGRGMGGYSQPYLCPVRREPEGLELDWPGLTEPSHRAQVGLAGSGKGAAVAMGPLSLSAAVPTLSSDAPFASTALGTTVSLLIPLFS